MKTLFRKLHYNLYNLLGCYAPDVCVYCGELTSLAEPDGGYPCCGSH
jgi:hypothetical protein